MANSQNLLSFERMIATSVIRIIYALGLILIAIGLAITIPGILSSILSLVGIYLLPVRFPLLNIPIGYKLEGLIGSFICILFLIIVALLWRIICEGLIVVFSI